MARRRLSRYETLRQLWQDLRLAWALLRDRRVPLWTKLVIPAAWATYFLLPLDVIPDLVPFLGELDDLMLLLLLVRLFIALSPPDVVADVRARQERGTQRRVIEGRYRVIEE